MERPFALYVFAIQCLYRSVVQIYVDRYYGYLRIESYIKAFYFILDGLGSEDQTHL